jgi:predicted glycoside hydrolase/deacetylase ChbG (UPF0249 family)
MNARLLIINADDFGYSHDTVEATIRCFEAGVLSSATMMPGMPAFEEAAAFARQHPEFSYGLHLCLTDERPVADPAEVPSLVTPGGSFWTTPEFFKRALTGRIARRDVQREVQAQLGRMREAGIAAGHLDAHGHVHKAPVVLHALRGVLRPSGITIVRRTQNLFYHRPRFSRRCCNHLANVFVRLLGRTTDYFLMVSGSLNSEDTHWWEDCLERLPTGVTEVGIHPGWDEEWRRLDMQPIVERGRQYLRNTGIRLISFHELPGLARS